MPLFGGGDKHEADNEALQLELQRIAALPLPQLAVATMSKGFGPGGPAAGGYARPSDIAGAFIPADSSHGLDSDLLKQLMDIVVEGIQVLEHACLVGTTVSGSGGVYDTYVTKTRLGQAALDQNGAERVLSDGTL
jgi:hypothetical protein